MIGPCPDRRFDDFGSDTLAAGGRVTSPIPPNPGPRDWSPPYSPFGGSKFPAMPSQNPPRLRSGGAANLGWKIATLVLGISTIVLAISLAGFTSVAAAPRTVVVGPPPSPSANPTKAPKTTPQTIEWVGGLVFTIKRVYSADTGWPRELFEAPDGTIRNVQGQILGSMPAGVHFGFAFDKEFGSYTITVVDPATLEVIVYSSAEDRILITR
jgi:hypothetical protein